MAQISLSPSAQIKTQPCMPGGICKQQLQSRDEEQQPSAPVDATLQFLANCPGGAWGFFSLLPHSRSALWGEAGLPSPGHAYASLVCYAAAMAQLILTQRLNYCE